MLRATFRLAILAVLVAAGSFGYWYFNNPQSPTVRIRKLEEEKKELQQIVQRLTDEKRVAQFIVLHQDKAPDGQVHSTTLLFEEHDARGNRVLQKTYTIEGEEVHIDALSIRFLDDFVMKNDPLRGHGLVFFTRIYGAQQPPAKGFLIDDPGQAPVRYRDPSNPKAKEASEYEQKLWKDFWKLVEDKSFRMEKGVQVPSGKGVWIRKVELGRLYTITKDAHGDPTLDWEPIPPILQEAMKRTGELPTTRRVE